MNTNRKSHVWFVILISLFLSGCGQTDSPINISAQSVPESPPTVITATQEPQQENLPSDGSCKKIVFVHERGEISDIFSVCPDGSHLTKLTDSTSLNTAPAWSPDGKRIAFSSTRNGNNQIFVMNADGSNAMQLTSDYENDYPVWLPDGEQIAFRTSDTRGLWWWRINNIKTREVTVFSEPTYDFFFQTPAWSPDGQRIAYMSLVEQKQRNDGSSQIHVKSIDGSNDIALTNDIWANINPIWSPDGKKIAFLSERDGTYNRLALYVISADGQDIRKLTEPNYFYRNKYTWSPDGTQIAIDSGDVSIGKIYIIDLDSGQKRELFTVSDGVRAYSPSWQP
jgi:Tol biopolymer transport system component